jgi:isoaspartyl peptidase/L-asparaginase-like protein (Ntn-hydrolase superfamily)
VTAVTTSGIAWKYPGRLGDSPILGAGNYCDSRFGAAAAMGFGELTMRHGTAVRAVMMLQQGMSLQQVGESVSHDIIALQQHVRRGSSGMTTFSGAWIRTLIMDAKGNCGGFSTASYQLNYKVMRIGDAAPRTEACWNAREGVAAQKNPADW